MKKMYSLILISIAISCSNGGSYKKAEDAQDAGREFIRASLDGDYKKARFYLLNDPDNLLMIEEQEHNYQEMTGEEKRQYRDASIRPISVRPANDSVTNYMYYQTSNPKDTTTLRIVRINGEWLVDLKSVIKM